MDSRALIRQIQASKRSIQNFMKSSSKNRDICSSKQPNPIRQLCYIYIRSFPPLIQLYRLLLCDIRHFVNFVIEGRELRLSISSSQEWLSLSESQEYLSSLHLLKYQY